ncbi:dihydroxyacetone kinase Dak1 [Podospora pseudoanserina]|uniref:Dihydroxyacetone kinase Dak1 n=1 Tax=Podospora pseudoanserina TaxID=2609844 RepID=A0ABR0IJ05_9PEZI|nr:dihydroxyacetone kinase Dak1 [Podospora pseudoanserina]
MPPSSLHPKVYIRLLYDIVVFLCRLPFWLLHHSLAALQRRHREIGREYTAKREVPRFLPRLVTLSASEDETSYHNSASDSEDEPLALIPPSPTHSTAHSPSIPPPPYHSLSSPPQHGPVSPPSPLVADEKPTPPSITPEPTTPTMSSKHFDPNPTHLLLTSLHSQTLTNPSLALDSQNKILYLRPSSKSSSQRVHLVSGGGAGHEPSFSGFVGTGLLSAAVSGTIFASPSAEQIRTCLFSRLAPSSETLVTVMNYTGDVLNFGLAVEKAKAAGKRVEMVIVGDDAAVGRTKGGKVGRRGVAGTVLVVKIAGALAKRGYKLDEVAKVARLVAGNLVSVGASLGRVHVPGRAVNKEEEGEKLGEDEVEIGMGIHNEAGVGREKMELKQLVGKMLRMMLDRNDKERGFVNVNSNEVVLLVNNLGGVSVLELGGIVAEVVKQLGEDWNIKPVRVLSGTYMTSLNGLGFSVSLLNVVNTDIGGPGMIELLDDECEATGWPAQISKLTWEERNQATREEDASNGEEVGESGLRVDAKAAQEVLTRGLEAVVAAEPDVTRYDTIVGDGDCGIGLKRGAEAILRHLSSKPLTGDVVIDLANIIPVVEMEMDGTSGALYAIFLNALVAALRTTSQSEKEASAKVWAAVLRQSCEALSKYTPARPGDRTLVDALYPFVNTLEETGDVKKAAEAAVAGAEGTKGMKASLGRTVYIGGSGFEEVPDPGAWGLASFFQGLAGIKKLEEDSNGWEKL